MVNTIHEIMALKMKHKEQIALMTEKAKGEVQVLAQVFEMLKTGSKVERGTAAEVLKFVSKDKPEMMLAYIDLLIECIDDEAPRVRWGCPESIGNIASKYPDKVEKAIPKLLENLKDESTVVRWCVAYALTEIAKYNLERQSELVEIIRALTITEQNNGVRKLYVKALKGIEKN
jgi:hypothetical protein